MKYKLTITGVDCPNCAAKLSGIMSDIEGVDSAKINFLTEKLTVESSLEESALMALLRDAANKFARGISIEK